LNNYIFTSESVTAGHPDKICDYISDCILDEALIQDPNSRMAVEATIKDDVIFLYGEYDTKAIIDFENIAKKCLKDIGYTEEYNVILKIGKQSQEIHQAVDKEDYIRAGDQGIMFGYACNETPTYMPAPIYYANLLAKELGDLQKKTPFLGPDGKTQVSVEYQDDKVKRIDTIVISTQHQKGLDYQMLYDLIQKEVIKKVIPSHLLDEKTNYLINPSGSFVKGGSFGDSGTTGRKLVCDTYGGMGRIGGGALSSKDPSKVDRTCAYYCRYVAKSIVASGLAKKCEIQVAYVIGQEEPVSIYLNTFQTGLSQDDVILKIVQNNFSFKVKDMINELDLLKPIYKNTSSYGHFGRDEFTWEKIKRLNRGCVIWKR